MLAYLSKNMKKFGQSKQSLFGTRWGFDTAFTKTAERGCYQFCDMDKSSPHRQLKDEILVALSTRSPVRAGAGQKQGAVDRLMADRTRFLNKLTRDSLDFLSQGRYDRLLKLQREQALGASMCNVVDRICRILQIYSFELNASVGFSELRSAITQPEHVVEVTRYSRSRHPLETVHWYRARLATSFYSLVVRGDKERIEIFLIPVSQAIGLSNSEQRYEPVAVLEATIVEEADNTVVWYTKEEPLTPALEELMSMELFLSLINKTKLQMLNSEEEHIGMAC